MTTTHQVIVDRAASAKSPVKSKRHMSLDLNRTTGESRRQAAAILEVLAGVRTPTDAAKALSLSLPAYYKLESRALRGLVLGCKPPGRGPRTSPEAEVQKLRRQCQRLGQELQRYQALARNAQRAAGLAAVAAEPTTDARGRRKRRPSVRALKAVASIRVVPEESSQPPSGALSPGGPT